VTDDIALESALEVDSKVLFLGDRFRREVGSDGVVEIEGGGVGWYRDSGSGLSFLGGTREAGCIGDASKK